MKLYANFPSSYVTGLHLCGWVVCTLYYISFVSFVVVFDVVGRINFENFQFGK